MYKVVLKRLFKKNEIGLIIDGTIDSPVLVEDLDGKVLWGNKAEHFDQKQPIKIKDDILGWVSGGDKAMGVAKLIAHFVSLEHEKKALGREALEKYREISMLYGITERLGASLSQEEVIQLVIEEVMKIIKIDNYSVMLLNDKTGLLETVACSGPVADFQKSFRPGEGIAGHALVSGCCEMVNDVLLDERYVPGVIKERALIVAPLKLNDKVIGVINISSEEPAKYTSEDMKILSVLAIQAAVVIQNAKLSFIRETFGRYLSDEVVNKLIENPHSLDLDGDKKLITIMMTDLRGFTNLSERMTPDGVVAILNNYLGIMVDIIQKYNGTILNFIGDAIVVVFGAPIWTMDHATIAVACAVEMQSAMEKVNAWNTERNYPEIQMGIGISTGHVIVGNIGSEKRTQYTCVGRDVNLASRIESYSIGGQIIISEETLRAGFVELAIGKELQVHPKGIKKPVRIYEIEGIEEPYNMYLPKQKLPMVILPKAIPIKITVVEGKHCDNNCFMGSILKLSHKEAEITADIEVMPMVEIKIQIIDSNDQTMADDIYAKTQDRTKSGSTFTVWITSVSREAKNIFDEALQTCTEVLE